MNPQNLLTLCLAHVAAFAFFVPEISADQPSPTTPIFSRAQFKYGLGRADYYGRWVDRPLFADPTLSDPASTSPSQFDNASYRKIQEIVVQSGLRGLGYFPNNRAVDNILNFTEKNKIPNFELLLDMTPAGSTEDKVAAAGHALSNPAAFRINDKVVIVSYLADQKSPEYWAEVLQKIREAHGDHFIFLPSIANLGTSTWISRFDQDAITPELEASAKEELRKWARATDGLYVTSRPRTVDRTFHEAFYRDFLIRLMKEVLAEPEFAGKKYLGLTACIGHENSTRIGYSLSSNATATLRHSLEAALSARPDVIVMPEWDEQNENSSVRPTVYNGRTAMRLLRHYTARERGELQEPLPGDDTSIPNLILSYRKTLILGEKLKLELLRVPERGVGEKETLKAQLALTDESGNVVYTSEEWEIPPGTLWEHSVSLPSEEFAKYRYLLPVLKVSGAFGERIFSEGV